MTVFYQGFDGGANGATINWDSTEPNGSPISEYYPSGGTGKFTTTNPIRGTASAVVSTAAGQNTAQIAYGMPTGTTTVRAHVYMRVPATLATDGQFLLAVNASRQVHVVARADGQLRLESWGTLIGTASGAGTLPAAGTIIRVALTVISGGNVTAAAYVGHSTTPIWTTTGPSGITGDISEVQAGIPWTHTPAAPLTVTVDDFRVDTTGSGLLPPEVVPQTATQKTWVREPVGWRRLGQEDAVEERWTPPAYLGALPPGQQNYTVPDGAIHVSPTGSDTTGTGRVDAPYATITKALTVATSGGTIALRGGNHHVGVAMRPDGSSGTAWPVWAGITADIPSLTIMGYPGEAAWLDGSSTVTGWTKVGAVWEKALTITLDRSPTGTSGADDYQAENWQYVNPARPYAARPERVWIDGVEQKQVADRASVVPGTFAVEGTAAPGNKYVFTSSKYILGTDPTGKTVRVVDLSTSISSTGGGFTLRGVGVRRYGAGVAQRGALKLRHTNSVIDNVTIEDCSALAVTFYQAHNARLTGVTVRRSGLLGIEGTESDDITIDWCVITDCNRQGFNYAPESGGVKLTHMRRPTVSRTAVYDCAGTGIWLDESVSNAVVHSCDIHWCDNNGIMSELSGGTTIANCAVTAPGSDGINIFNVSGKVRIWNNTVSRPGRLSQFGRCVSIVADDRAPLKAGSVGLDPRYGFPHPDGLDALTVDVTVNNNVLGPSPSQGFLWNDDYNRSAGNGRDWSKFGIKANSNVYVIRRDKPDWKWVLSNAGSADPTILWSLSDLRSRGIDTTSTIVTGLDYGSDINAAPTTATINAKPAGQPIPADIAALIGAPTGSTTTIGAAR